MCVCVYLCIRTHMLRRPHIPSLSFPAAWYVGIMSIQACSQSFAASATHCLLSSLQSLGWVLCGVCLVVDRSSSPFE